MKNYITLIGILATIILISSCNSYQRILNGNDIDLKASTGIQYYKNKHYQKAMPLLESVLPLYRGSKKGEDLYYYYAKSQYETRDYYSSSYHFKTFYEYYPTSQYAKEALFLSGYSSYLLSPHYSLDQEDSKSALAQLQVFVNTYPNDDLVDSCNKIIDLLFLKFRKKELENSKTYYRTERYQSALVSINNYITKYPDDKSIQNLKLILLDSHYKLYKNSTEKKKDQRLKDAIDYYKQFETEVDDKNLRTDAEKILKKIYAEKEAELRRKTRRLKVKKFASEFY